MYIFLGVPETLAHHSLWPGSISPREFYICCLDWLSLPSEQQRCSFFLPCRSQLFSFRPERTQFSGVLPQVLPFLFMNIAWCCLCRMILSGVCTSNILQAIFLHMARALFIASSTYVSSSAGFPVMSLFLAFEAPQVHGYELLNSFKTIADLPLLRRIWLINVNCKCWSGSVIRFLRWRFFLCL